MPTNLAELAARSCRPLRGPEHALADDVLAAYLAVLPDWHRQDGVIGKTYRFANYHETMAFVNAVAFIAHREDHHPDLHVGYATCRVLFNTHDVGGISENDVVCAAKVEWLLHRPA